MNRIYVTCPVCGRNYVGVIPKGGDGSLLCPRLHFQQPAPATSNLGIMIAKYPGKRVYCPGSFMEGRGR